MKTPNKISRKGWNLLSSSNIVSTCSSVVIAIALIFVLFLYIALETGLNISYTSVVVFLICIIVADILALLFVLIGRLLQWKGLTLLLGALQIPDSIMQDTTPQYTIDQEKQDL